MISMIEVIAPPGNLGIYLGNNGNTDQKVRNVITKVDDDSPLAGKVYKGDQIVAFNGFDVRGMDATSKITVKLLIVSIKSLDLIYF